MSVALESKNRINALIAAANAATGNADTDLTAAVGALIAGFGQGSSGGGASGIYMAQITPASDTSHIVVTHNLGTTDILLATVFAETLGDFVPERNGTLANLWAKTDIPIIRSGVGYDMKFRYDTGNTYITYAMSPDATSFAKFPDENTAKFTAASGSAATMFFAGVTYTVIIIAANAEV